MLKKKKHSQTCAYVLHQRERKCHGVCLYLTKRNVTEKLKELTCKPFFMTLDTADSPADTVHPLLVMLISHRRIVCPGFPPHCLPLLYCISPSFLSFYSVFPPSFLPSLIWYRYSACCLETGVFLYLCKL